MAKKFLLDQNLSSGFSEVINLAEKFVNKYESTPLTISRITPDPTNRRFLSLNAVDINKVISSVKIDGLAEINIIEKVYIEISKSLAISPNKEIQLNELKSIKELAIGISKNGLLNPIIAYKQNEDYVLVAGERRYLAHIMMNRKHIESRVFIKKPTDTEIKIAQWIENIHRKDLNTYGKIKNVQDISLAYEKEHNTPLTPTLLSSLSGESKASASCYLTIINGPEDVLVALEKNRFQGIKKAVFICQVDDTNRREELIRAAASGENLSSLKARISKNKSEANRNKNKKKGRSFSKIQFGSTKDPLIAKKIILAVSNQYDLKDLNLQIQENNINWESYEDVSMAFKKLIANLGNIQ